MNTLLSSSFYNAHILKFCSSSHLNFRKNSSSKTPYSYKKRIEVYASSNELDTKTMEESKKEPNGVTKVEEEEETRGASKIITAAIDKDLKKVVQSSLKATQQGYIDSTMEIK